MAFVLAVIDAKPVGASSTSGIKATLAKYRNGPAQLLLSIGGEAFDALGFSADSKVEVLLGTENDHGLLRLRADKKGQATVAQKKAPKGSKPYQTIRLGHQQVFVDRAEKAQACHYEKVDGYFEIVLPPWADETHPTRKKTSPAPVEPAAERAKPVAPKAGCVPAFEPRRPGRPKRNVTADMMGDPAPGRREAVDAINP